MHLDIAMNHCGAGGAAVHKTVSILGTEYKIEIHSPKEDECLKRNDWMMMKDMCLIAIGRRI